MQLAEAIPILERNIKRNLVHDDYERVRDLAVLYRRLITGEEADKLLRQFAMREDDALFAQRVALTQLVTPALASSLQKPYSKVARNEKIKKRLDIKEEARKETVENMLDLFYGNDPDQNGLDYWLQTRFEELSHIDPNAWVVIEFDAFDPAVQFAQPRPFEVSAEEAVNFNFINDVLQWLLVRQEIKVIIGLTTDSNGDEVEKTRDGYTFTFYTDQNAIQYREVDIKYLREIGYTKESALANGEELIEVWKDHWYIRRVTEPKIGYVPAFRVGYKRDPATKGRTFVNTWHEAMPFMMKSVKACSEMDLTMALHVFPQKIQYVQKCAGQHLGDNRYKTCNRGRCNDGSVCQECKGTGYKVHTSAQDAILLPMPQDKEEALDLSNIVHYVNMDIALLQFQKEYGDALELKSHRAVFNTTVFIETQIAKTATEKDYDMDSAYDTLLPFAKKISWTWKFVARTAIVLADVPENDRQEVIHQFPGDFKLKTTSLLVNELRTLNDSGAPPFVIDVWNEDIAEIMYAGDDLKLLKYRVKKSFYPFNGKTEDEIAALMESPFVPKAQKVLYANFEPIFALIEEEDPLFWYIEDFGEQKAKVDAKVAEIQAITDAEAPPPPGFESDRSGEGQTIEKPNKGGLQTGGNNPNE